MHAEASRDATQLPDTFHAIESFQAGRDREQSFRLLFDIYHQPLRRFFARKGLVQEACRDLTQEVFLYVYRGLATYQPQARFETWLYRVATTTYLKHLRYRATAKRAGEEVSAERVEETARPLAASGLQLERLLADEQRRALRRAVRTLPEKMRRCLELKVYRELGCREIAATLAVSTGTVKTHLFQARGKLRQELAPTPSDETRPRHRSLELSGLAGSTQRRIPLDSSGL